MDNSSSLLSSHHMRRPFKRRRKQALRSDQEELCHHRQQHHHYHQHEQIASTYIPSAISELSSAIRHHLPAAATTTITTARKRCGRTRSSTTTTISHNLRYSSPRALALFFYLSFVACVIMSLLNLTPIMSLQLAASASAAASSATSLAVMSQQQQSNSVIQYPATATTTTTAVKARYKTMYACEDRQLSMDCEIGSKINLIRANFGRFSITQCNEQGQLDLQTDCMSPITFRIMQEKCQDKQRCSVNATSLIFGDKCPKTRKYLEVHFQCQTIEPDMVNLKTKPSTSTATNSSQIHGQSPILGYGSGDLKPPNNPTSTPRSPLSVASSTSEANYLQAYPEEPNEQQHQPQILTPVINSHLMSSSNAMNNYNDPTTNVLDQDNRETIIIPMRHLQIEKMSRPRCYQWDGMSSQWTEQGAQIIKTNQTHTICAFDRSTSYVLVMDYSGPLQTISPTLNSSKQQGNLMNQPSTNPIINSPPNFLENQPMPIDSLQQPGPYLPSQFDVGRLIYPPTLNNQQQLQPQQQSTSTKLFTLFGYLLAIIFVLMGLMTLAFVASSMRSSAGAALKSLGNFTPFNGPKYNKRRQGHQGPASLHSNKDLLVINNANGHQFIYAPASTTKISSSPSTHILSTGQPTGLAGQHQGSLHRIQQQQQQMYSGNGATLSSLSGTGAQSNNYYYGLMGLNPIFQQQQSHHFSQHHLNHQPQQQHQVPIATNYNHQANKSTISAESANSSSSSSGVESSSTSMQQQQQQQQQQQAPTQQACLVSTSSNQNDFNLMGSHISSNYGQHQQQNMFAPQQHQPGALTLNAHYSTSGGLQSMNMSPAMHSRQASSQLRDHIYECVDDDKPYMARLLMPTNNEQQQQFGTLGHQQFSQQASNNSRAMTLSSRLLHDVFQQQQQQLQQQTTQNCNTGGVARRNFPQTAIVRDHQSAKTNIICSKTAQVTPQRATEIGIKSSHFGHTDVMAIYNKNDATTMTTAHQQPTSTNNSCYGQRVDTNMALNSQGKLSTDC